MNAPYPLERSLVHYSVLVLFALSSHPVVLTAQHQGTFVAGRAVYRNAESVELQPAVGVELMLLNGAFEGPIQSPSSSVLDQDITASRFNKYRPEDEGIFQLYTRSDLKVVSIAHYRKDASEAKDGEPDFFSKTIYPRPLRTPKGDRSVAKLQLELWPTIRPVTNATTMKKLTKEVIVAHVSRQKLENEKAEQKSDDATKRRILTELRILVNLLQVAEPLRLEIVAQTVRDLPEVLRPLEEFPANKVLGWIPPAGDKFWAPGGDELKDARTRWDRFRARLKYKM